MTAPVRLRQTQIRAACWLLTAPAGFALLTGCAGDYSATVKNSTTRPLFAAMFERDEQGAMKRLGSTRIAPDGEETLGPVQSKSGNVLLFVDPSANPRNLKWISVPKGRNSYEATQVVDQPNAPIQVSPN